MKKIGIITYHASHNIGSMLQAYALQTYLEKNYNYKVEFIDYSSPAQRNMYSISPKLNKNEKNLKKIAKKIKDFLRLPFYPLLKTRFDDFEKFKHRYLKLSDHNYIFSKEIDELEFEYDYIFLGSDQIWNVNCIDFTDVYFADFQTSATLVAYAPSLGGKNIITSDVDLEGIKKLISKIEYLSVRESNGKYWLEELTDRSVDILLDPTLLLDKKSWHSFLDKHSSPPHYENYIFFYGIPFSNKTYPVLEQISKKLGLNVVMIDAKSWIVNYCAFRGFLLEKHCSPLDYLSLIKNASMIITTSYHGTIFSTIFEKNFWTLTFQETNVEDDRIPTLLDQLGLEDRFINLEDVNNIDLTKVVDYSNYSHRLKPFLSKSEEFIAKILK